ncbi:hypothetical protein PM082_014780 [Marasmius tenuissimus]|nr:hypothetical protein PM082_014780 [Marasmius tenuissimus]
MYKFGTQLPQSRFIEEEADRAMSRAVELAIIYYGRHLFIALKLLLGDPVAGSHREQPTSGETGRAGTFTGPPYSQRPRLWADCYLINNYWRDSSRRIRNF